MSGAPSPGVPVPYGHRFRPVRASDLTRLLVADPSLDEAAGRRRLTRWLAETREGAADTFVLVDDDETALLGVLRASRTEVSWWIVRECEGTDLAAAVADVVSEWPTRSGTRWG